MVLPGLLPISFFFKGIQSSDLQKQNTSHTHTHTFERVSWLEYPITKNVWIFASRSTTPTLFRLVQAPSHPLTPSHTLSHPPRDKQGLGADSGSAGASGACQSCGPAVSVPRRGNEWIWDVQRRCPMTTHRDPPRGAQSKPIGSVG